MTNKLVAFDTLPLILERYSRGKGSGDFIIKAGDSHAARFANPRPSRESHSAEAVEVGLDSDENHTVTPLVKNCRARGRYHGQQVNNAAENHSPASARFKLVGADLLARGAY